MTTKIPAYVPKHSLRWYVGTLNVSVSDETLTADITQRLREHNRKLTSEQIEHCVSFALSEHHKNQALYYDVVTARI